MKLDEETLKALVEKVLVEVIKEAVGELGMKELERLAKKVIQKWREKGYVG